MTMLSPGDATPILPQPDVTSELSFEGDVEGLQNFLEIHKIAPSQIFTIVCAPLEIDPYACGWMEWRIVYSVSLH